MEGPDHLDLEDFMDILYHVLEKDIEEPRPSLSTSVFEYELIGPFGVCKCRTKTNVVQTTCTSIICSLFCPEAENVWYGYGSWDNKFLGYDKRKRLCDGRADCDGK